MQTVQRGRPTVHDRQAILHAARAVAAERGYDALRFADVAAASRVAVSSLQYSFGTREGLVREVIRSGVHEEFWRLKAAAQAEPDPWRRVCVLITRQISTDDDERHEGWLLWLEFWRAAVRDAQIQREYAVLAQQWRDLMADAVRQGVADGEFGIEGTVADSAAALVALIDGVLLQVEVGDVAMTARRGIRIAKRSATALLGVTA